jgi:hypothetical protein
VGAQDFFLIAEGFDSGTLSTVDFEKRMIICHILLILVMLVCFFDLPSSFITTI